MTDVDPNFLSRQIERLVSDIAALRDDMRVLSANGDSSGLDAHATAR
jgi:hypothetical protein